MYSEVAFVDEYRIALFAVEITCHHSCVQCTLYHRKLKPFRWSDSVEADVDNISFECDRARAQKC